MKKRIFTFVILAALARAPLAAGAHYDSDTGILSLPGISAGVLGDYAVTLRIVNDNPITVELISAVKQMDGITNPDAVYKQGSTSGDNTLAVAAVQVSDTWYQLNFKQVSDLISPNAMRFTLESFEEVPEPELVLDLDDGLGASSTSTASCDANSYAFGAGKYDITGPAAEQGMMGYAQVSQRSTGIHMRQWARAFNIKECGGNNEVIMVVADLGQMFESVRQGVLKKLATLYGTTYTYKNVMISATHTHQGAGGYSHRALYNLSTLGFSEQTYNAIVDGIIEAIKLAIAARSANQNVGTKIYWDWNLVIDEETGQKGAFNRSSIAYDANSNKYDFLEEFGGIDPYARQLTFIDNASGAITGIINSYAVHPSVLGNDNLYLSSDSKGYSAWYTEQAYPDAVAAFPNGWDGDMSPNFDGIPSNTVEDYADLKEMGKLYADQAITMIERAEGSGTLLSGPIQYEAHYVEMPGLEVPASFSESGTAQTLCTPALGFSMFAGSTEDGPGLDFLSEGMDYRGLFDTIDAGISSLVGFDVDIPDAWLAPVLSNTVYSECHKEKPVALYTDASAVGGAAWTETVVPIQLLQIGNMTVYPVPYESTVTAGVELQETVETVTGESTMYLPIGLANGYVGYVTTREEYATQNYEGASVHFGPYTHNAFTYLYYRVANKMVNGLSLDDIAEGVQEDLSGSQISLQTGVVYDDAPLDCQMIPLPPFVVCLSTFGNVLNQPDSSYIAGETVTVEFQSAHPKNNLRTMDTFLKIQKYVDGVWEDYLDDNHPNTFYKWERDPDLLDAAYSTVQVIWNTDASLDEAGEYRIQHFGDYKSGLDGSINGFSGTSNSFTLQSNTPSVAGNALSFDGSGDYVALPNEASFDFSNTDFTVEAWIKVDSFTSGWQTIIAKGDDSWRIARDGTNNTLQFALNNAGGGYAVIKGRTMVNDSEWHHVAGVANLTNDMLFLYVDGVLDAWTPFTDTLNPSNYEVQIGANAQKSGRNFDGEMDEVRIWNTARSRDEIQAYMNSTMSGTESNLVAYYQFDESSGTTASDTTGSYDGTLNGDPEWVESTALLFTATFYAATFYGDCNYSTSSAYTVGLPTGEYTLSELADLGITNDTLSSLTVTAGYQVTLYQHDNFSGNSIVLDEDDSCLTGEGMNDQTSSIKIEFIAATFYGDCNYSTSSAYTVGLPTGEYTLSKLADLGITNDSLSSLTVTDGYQVTLYQHDNFSGNSIVLDEDDSCLTGEGMNDQASSIKIEKL